MTQHGTLVGLDGNRFLRLQVGDLYFTSSRVDGVHGRGDGFERTRDQFFSFIARSVLALVPERAHRIAWVQFGE